MANFYRCRHCGNIIIKLTDSGVPVRCCGEDMGKLEAHVDDQAATEKHVPIVEVSDQLATVKVGSVDHPMDPDHYIEWIYLETTKESELIWLKPGEAPRADFATTSGAEVVVAYVYCNLHGLWQSN